MEGVELRGEKGASYKKLLDTGAKATYCVWAWLFFSPIGSVKMVGFLQENWGGSGRHGFAVGGIDGLKEIKNLNSLNLTKFWQGEKKGGGKLGTSSAATYSLAPGEKLV